MYFKMSKEELISKETDKLLEIIKLGLSKNISHQITLEEIRNKLKEN